MGFQVHDRPFIKNEADSLIYPMEFAPPTTSKPPGDLIEPMSFEPEIHDEQYFEPEIVNPSSKSLTLAPDWQTTRPTVASQLVSMLATQTDRASGGRVDGASARTGLEPKNWDRPNPYQTMERMLSLCVFCVVDECLYVFTGTHYAFLSAKNAQRLILEHCREDVQKAGGPNFPKAVYELMLIEPKILRNSVRTASNIVSFQNGLLELRTGCLMPHSPAYFTTYTLNCFYLETGNDCPNFSRFLSEISGNDPALIQRIWEIFGYCLVPDTGGKVIFLLQGVANSGKSLLASVLGSFFPDEVVTALDVHDLRSRFSVSELQGKALCLSPDLPAGYLDAQSTSELKRASGNDLITSDVKYEGRAKFYCTTKFVLVSNHPLITKHPDQAFIDRLVVVPFRFGIPKELRNPQLAQEFDKEKGAIAYHAIQSYQNLVRNHYQFSGQYSVNDVVADDDSGTSSLPSDWKLWECRCSALSGHFCYRGTWSLAPSRPLLPSAFFRVWVTVWVKL